MHLARVRLLNVTPFDDVTLSFTDEGGESSRRMNVVFGGDRTGKTTLLAAIATTRPGFAVPPPPGRKIADRPSFITCEWRLGEDDPERPHPLLVASPTAQLEGETAEEGAFRRKEQALFDRRAQEQGGFGLLLVSGARWFSRTPNLLSQPERTVARYDVRAAPVLDDATRADLTRETKQILSYAAIGAALERSSRASLAKAGEGALGHGDGGDASHGGRQVALASALEEALAVLLEPFQRNWAGVSAETFEPIFVDASGVSAPFEELPRGARHLVSIATLAIRMLAGAYPEGRSPREREGVVLVDDIELGQDLSIARLLPRLLPRALPSVQWILTTASPLVVAACAPGESIALRRSDQKIEVHEHERALIH